MPIPNRPLYSGSFSTDDVGGDLTPSLATLPPDVIISVPHNLIRTTIFVVTFTFTQDVEAFVSSEVAVSVGTIGGVEGDGDTFTAQITLPNDSQGQGTITFAANTVENSSGVSGPTEDRVVSFGYDTRTTTLTSPANSCETSYSFTDATFPYAIGGGAYEPPLEMLAVQHSGVDYIYAVIQLSEYVTTYEKVPRDVTLSAQGLNLDQQARAALIKVNLSTCATTILKQYPYCTVAARSLTLKDDKVYWIEGSHYSAWNAGEFLTIEDPDAKFYVLWGDFTRKTTPALDGEYGISGNTITLLTSRTSAAYGEIQDALRNHKYLHVGSALLKTFNFRLTDVNINVARIQFEFVVLNGTLPAVDEEQPININIGKYVEAYSKFRLQPTYHDFISPLDIYKNNYRGLIGHVYSVDASDTIVDLGLNWRSSGISEDPNRDAERAYYETAVPDRFYGVHGGTTAPMLDDGNRLLMVTGYSDATKFRDTGTETSRLGNWNLIAYDDELNQRVSVLETNDRTAFEVVQDAAIISDSYVAFDNNQFIFKPKVNMRGQLALGIDASAVGFALDNVSRDTLPSSGTVRIDNEIMTYTGISNNTLSGVTRGVEGTTAAAHGTGAYVHWIDHFIDWDRHTVDPVDRFVVKSDSTNIFNHVRINYAGTSYKTDDTKTQNAQSIARYGLREYEVTLPLDETQGDVAKYLAEAYVAEYRIPRAIVTMRLKLSLYLKMFEVLQVVEPDRTHLNHIVKVVNIDHQLFRNQTNVTCQVITTEAETLRVADTWSFDDDIWEYNSEEWRF